MTDGPSASDYALETNAAATIAAPDLPYQPPMPKRFVPCIGVIGAGGIVDAHLDAYRTAGWEVAVICNRTLAKAEAKRDAFYPNARVTTSAQDVLDDPNVNVVDITPHPADRLPLIETALQAGKHVLSQKPFVLDLDEGARLVALARDKGVKLAVNQNGRWAPHLAWMRSAVREGLIGDLVGAHVCIHWDHRWIAGTPFEQIEDLILYDFGIHWFDFLTSIAPGRATFVFASAAKVPGAKVPLAAQVLVEMDGAQASLVFDGATPHGARDTTFLAGTLGSLQSDGPDLGQQHVTLTTEEGRAEPHLQGTWFNDGFRGAMGALCVAIEDDAEPENGAEANLESLALAFAAMQSRRTRAPVNVADVRGVTL